MKVAPGVPAVRIRWRMFAFLFGFGLLAYMQQKSITVAAARIMPDLSLSQLEIGWLEQAFVIGYAVFQMPGGIFGQRIGARRTFVIIGLIACLAMIATSAGPAILGGRALFVELLSVQLLLGIAQAAIFPVSAGVFETWFPPRRWAYVQGMQTMGLQLGAAMTPPLIATLMHIVGWQQALFWTTLPALALIALWAWYARDSPREHPAMTPVELAEIGDRAAASVDASIDAKQLLRLLRDRNVLLLALSYLCMNYAFYLLANWVFLYLIQERHFSVLESGWLASAPPLAAAAGAGIGGALTGLACRRFGVRSGFRLVPLAALPAAGLLLLFAVNCSNPFLAVVTLAVCYGCVELNEGAYWGAAMMVGGGDTMAICGFMNTGGNLGGIIGIPIVAYLSGHHQWHAAFLIGAGCALLAAAAWLGIDAERPQGSPPPISARRRST
ncbi:MAG TPA: MFS transporter [Steroidobacteraceae bacterium]|nr:MFS transporter [Steroidobacteraceae bacterium]